MSLSPVNQSQYYGSAVNNNACTGNRHAYGLPSIKLPERNHGQIPSKKKPGNNSNPNSNVNPALVSGGILFRGSAGRLGDCSGGCLETAGNSVRNTVELD